MNRMKRYFIAVTLSVCVLMMQFVTAKAFLLSSTHLPDSYSFAYSTTYGLASDWTNCISNGENQWPSTHGTFFRSGTNTATAFSNNGNNEVMKANYYPSDFLCASQKYSSGGLVSEADIKINAYYTWCRTGTCSLTQVDLESNIAHEFGHVIGLRDIYNDNTAVMYYTFDYGEERSVGGDDLLGFYSISW